MSRCGSLVIVVMGLLVGAEARAQISLGGSAGGVIDPRVEKVIPAAAGDVVVINFSACTGVRLCSSLSFPGNATSCVALSVTAVAGAGGATFRICGSGSGPGALPLPACAAVTINGVPTAPNLIVSTYDLDGIGGVTALDLGIWAHYLYTAYDQRADYNADTTVNALDLGMFAAVLFGGGSVLSCAALCP